MDTPSPRRGRRILRWAITVAVLATVAVFFGLALVDNWDRVAAEQLNPDWLWLPATAIFAVAVPLTGLLWARMLRVLSPSVTLAAREAVALQCASWLLKYIPGQVGSVVNKVAWAARKGISRSLVVITFVYENVFLQIASIVPAGVILLISLGPGLFGDNAALLITPVVVLVPLLMMMYKPFFHGLVNFPVRRILKHDIPPQYFLGSVQVLRFIGEFVGPRVLNGVAFVMIASTVASVPIEHWLPFAAAYVLAGAIGILAFFVPSGLGVREAVIVLVLSQYISVAEAIIISLLARLLSTVADLLVAAIYLFTRRTIAKEHRP
ncbi:MULTISPECIES: lysylphosphatidylglycerol synthase domain-containing protein [Microbacterium]|uniref:lysylphosphatidylglycerol synthase domain-containing protein n=1 Tax=Microbacterium TaxID=33882 RepID=UPI00214C81FE|nr:MULTISPECIES: lysylphosphatidylglycerol synthase domain-containing protein [unclassified Microbacterium]MCR2813590.1 lysylphosphatidylglycerol synthase domain-containing protein [Microbacterium sp. zg.Y1084]MDL5486595.1 lysylphosphatidylglycerol synthase domain-containing protein [Microbacterium sp. zg-Y1211]